MNDSERNYIHLRGLPYSATKGDILKFLSGVNIPRNEEGIVFLRNEDGKLNGDCYVEVATQEDSEKGLHYNRKYMGKRYIEVFVAHKYDFEEVSGYNSLEGNDFCVRLVGLPYACTEDDVNRFFRGLDIKPDGITLLYRRDGQCLGDGFVEFCSSEHASKALNKHHLKIGQRFIEVYRCTKVEIDIAINASRSRSTSTFKPRRNSDSHKNNRSNSYNRDSYKNITPSGRNYYSNCPERFSEECYIHVRGIPFDIEDQELEDMFIHFNPYCISQRCKDDGRFNGEVDVYFSSEGDCLDCLHNINTRIGNCYLEVFSRFRRVRMLKPVSVSSQEIGYLPTQPEICTPQYFDYSNSIREDYVPGFNPKYRSRETLDARTQPLYPDIYNQRPTTFEY